MKKLTKINFIIDVILFLLMASIGGIGLLIKYRLISGSERWEIYGSNPELYVWGWDRHQWADLHVILGYVIFGLLFFHLVLHWRQIKGIYRKMVLVRPWQVVLAFAFVIASLFLLFFGFISPVDIDPLAGGGGAGRMRLETERYIQAEPGAVLESSRELSGDADADEEPVEDSPEAEEVPPVPLRRNQEPLHEDHAIHEERTLEIDGTSTIGEVAARYNVPAESIKKALGIPSGIPDNERLGRLRRQYGFYMSDVERIINEYRQINQ